MTSPERISLGECWELNHIVNVCGRRYGVLSANNQQAFLSQEELTSLSGMRLTEVNREFTLSGITLKVPTSIELMDIHAELKGGPGKWLEHGYWSATQTSSGYVCIYLHFGFASGYEHAAAYVALQVVKNEVPA